MRCILFLLLNNAIRGKARTLKKYVQEQVKLVFKYFHNLKKAKLHTVLKSQVESFSEPYYIGFRCVNITKLFHRVQCLGKFAKKERICREFRSKSNTLYQIVCVHSRFVFYCALYYRCTEKLIKFVSHFSLSTFSTFENTICTTFGAIRWIHLMGDISFPGHSVVF